MLGGGGLPARPSVQDGGGTAAAPVKFGDPVTIGFTGSDMFWVYDDAHNCSINVDAPNTATPSLVLMLLDASSPTAWCGNYGGQITIGAPVYVVILASLQPQPQDTNSLMNWWCGADWTTVQGVPPNPSYSIYTGCGWAALSANNSTASFVSGKTISDVASTVFSVGSVNAAEGSPLTYGTAITLKDAGGAYITYDTYGVGDLGHDSDPAEAMLLTVCNAEGESVITAPPNSTPTPPPTKCTQTCQTWTGQSCGGSPGSFSCPANSTLNCSQNDGCTCVCEKPTGYTCANATGPSDPRFPVTNPSNCAFGTAECTSGVGCNNGQPPTCDASSGKWTCGNPASLALSPIDVAVLVIGAAVVLFLIGAAIFSFVRASIRTSRATR